MLLRIGLISIFLLISTLAGARDITLAWESNTDPNTEPDIAGYKVYYKADQQTLPLDGIGADMPSPVDIGNQTTATLSGFYPGKIYYFAVTAYNSAGYESALSNIVASDWVPVLLEPEPGGAALQYFRFTWSEAPPDLNVSYTLYYGTDPELRTADPPAALPLSGPRAPTPPAFLLPTLAALLALVMLRCTRRGRWTAVAAAFLGGALLVASCGGGGEGAGGSSLDLTGGDSTTVIIDEHGEVIVGGEVGAGGGGGEGSNTSPPALFTRIVPNIPNSYYSVAPTDLTPGTTYYWKVMADDGTMLRQSIVSQFTVQ